MLAALFSKKKKDVGHTRSFLLFICQSFKMEKPKRFKVSNSEQLCTEWSETPNCDDSRSTEKQIVFPVNLQNCIQIYMCRCVSKRERNKKRILFEFCRWNC